MILTFSTIHYFFQAVTLFNADQHEEAMTRVQELAKACPGADIHACWIVEVSIMLNQSQVRALALNFVHQAHLHLLLGIHASDNARHDKAADHFTAAINASDFSTKFDIDFRYDYFVVVR